MPHKIYIVLTHTSTNLAKLIRLATRYEYNHVSIALDENLTHMYSFGRHRPRNPFFAGFVQENRFSGFYAVFIDTISRVYELEISDSQYRRLLELIKNFDMESDKYKFNLLGLFLNRFGIPFSRANHYFCAQFVSYLLDEADIYSFNKNHKLTRIDDFEHIKDAQVIYEGFLTDYSC